MIINKDGHFILCKFCCLHYIFNVIFVRLLKVRALVYIMTDTPSSLAPIDRS
jgi:hypothetical protein